MKTIKIKSIRLSIIVVLIVSLVACNSKAKKNEVKDQAVLTAEVVVEDSKQDYQVGAEIPKDMVCMVNDAYMGKPQIPVPVNGKTYYGCCQMCVGTLNNNEDARVAKDPVSNNNVDKTEAYIVLLDKEGKVGYFESEKNFLKFKNDGGMTH
ncbi:MAG: hypothetical protein GY739_06640 [Mesoflavibacter sp.]|nr:hypothetical protein [Mesoflavibacter sp.]